MMGQQHRIELRASAKLWAIWAISDAGMVLRHDLDDVRIATCPGLLAYENGRQLLLRQGSGLIIGDQNGIPLREVVTDDSGVLKDVVDPQGKVLLVVEADKSPGSIGDQPIQASSWMLLGLRPTKIR